MASNIISPFSGWPATRQKIDKSGLPVFTVSPRVLTPVRAKIADLLAGISAAVILVGSVYIVAHLPGVTGWHWLTALASPWIGYHLFKVIWRFLLRKTTRIVLTQDQFKVRTWTGWKVFDRRLPHKFAVLRHDKTMAERDKHELEVRKEQAAGNIISKARYYGESWHLSFEYLDQRNDVMTIFGQKEARAVRDRLKAIDEVLDASTRKGDGTALDPNQQWTEQPGDIPETD